MILDDLLGRRKAETGAEAARAEKGLEDPRQNVGRDAGAGIGDRDLDHVAHRGRDHDPLLGKRGRLDQRLERVLEHLDDRTAQAIGIDRHDRAGRAEPALDGDPMRHFPIVEHFRKPWIELDRRSHRVARARIVEHIADDPVAAIDRAVNAIHQPRDIDALQRCHLTDRMHRIADSAERVAQLMRERRRQPPKQREPLLLQELRLHRCARTLGFRFLRLDLQLPLGQRRIFVAQYLVRMRREAPLTIDFVISRPDQRQQCFVVQLAVGTCLLGLPKLTLQQLVHLSLRRKW